jgi:hypothetical protein
MISDVSITNAVPAPWRAQQPRRRTLDGAAQQPSALNATEARLSGLAAVDLADDAIELQFSIFGSIKRRLRAS